jgi:hypothetical protein
MTDTWYAIVDAAGALVSTGTVIADAEALAAAGYTAQTLTGNPAGQVWDVASRAFVAPPAKPAIINTWQFIQRFTPTEYAGIEASADPVVRQYLTTIMTAATVNLSEPIVQQGIAYLVSLNLVTSDRAAIIGAS